jgi:uncharacterized protein YuzE
MKIKYFEDTDTALIELRPAPPAETRELSEDVYLDFDSAGHVVSITLEHASRLGNLSEVMFERVGSGSVLVRESD